MSRILKDRGVTLKLAVAGLLSGVVNGLLGAGGGIIIVFAVSRLLSEQLSNKNDVFSMALCVMLPISLVSCVIYALRGHMSMDGFGIFLIPAIIGGVIGGLLLGRLKAAFMRKLFAILVIISGILLIVR